MYTEDSYMLECNVTDEIGLPVASDDVENAPLCYWCASDELTYMGTLGHTAHYQCRRCGMGNTGDAADVEQGA